MNKKFINGLLLASLILGGASSLTSCKDYDDDIDNLQEQIDGIETKLGEIEALIAKGSVITSVASTDNGVTITLSDGKSFTITNGKDGKDGTNGTVWTIGEDGYWYQDGVKTDYLARGPQGPAGEQGPAGPAGPAGSGSTTAGPEGPQGPAGNYYVPNPDTKTFWLYDGKTNTAIEDTKISYIGTYTGITAVDNGYEVLLFGVDPQNPDKFFSISKSGALKSLVLIPQLYADGIESVEYGYTFFKPWQTSAGALTVNNQEGVSCTVTSEAEEWNYTKQGAALSFSPTKTVSYHVNPSAAQIKADQVSLLSNEVETISRAAAGAGLSIVNEAFALKDGIMTIGIKAAKPEAIKTAEDKEATIFAAQVKVNNKQLPDTTVTSDYAMLYASQVIPQAIAFNTNVPQATDCPNKAQNDELYATVKEAIENAPSLSVAYTSSINLNALEIHYNWETNTKNAGKHLIWKYGEEAAYGLSYDYALIDYKSGSNATEDSKYCKLDGSVLTPYGVNESGEPTFANGISSVGRQPIVRVRVMQGNNVVLVGFIKVNIVKEVDFKVTNVVKLEGIKFGCNDATRKVNWSTISDYILENTAAQSKDEFNALYELEVSNGEAVQYVAAEKDGKMTFTPATAAQEIGTVTELTNATGTTTDVLQWVLSMDDQQVVYEKPEHTATVYVAYVHRVAPTIYANIYVRMMVNVSKPAGNVTTKVQANWMRNQSVTMLNVPQPTDNQLPTPFAANLNEAWATGSLSMPSFNPTAGYPSYTAAIFKNQGAGLATGGYKYYFTAANNRTFDGVTYSVDNATVKCLVAPAAVAVKDMGDHALLADNGEYTNTVLYAKIGSGAKTKIATIDQTTGVITYEDNAVAKELLNKYASNGDGLDRSNAKLYAEIGICAYTPCGIAMQLTNATYPSYILRPINVYAGAAEFTDAVANGSRVNMFDLLTFDDWRGVAFTGKDAWLFAYYDVQSVTARIADMTTNAVDGTNFAKFDAVTAAFSIDGAKNMTWSNRTAANAENILNKAKTSFGTIVYDNTKYNKNTFKVRIPVDITYYWGTVTVNVEATVNNTLNPGN